jgi:heme a synthase
VGVAGPVGAVDRSVWPSRAQLRGLGVASLVANVVIIVTGGAVRLTGSGLGCPTWPRCTGSSFVVHDAMGVHGFIEFGNRMLTFVLVAVAITTWVAAMRYRPASRPVRILATVLVLGVPAQALIGGVTVLTDLNPWVVALHLLSSMAIVGVAVVFIHRVDDGDRPARPPLPSAVAALGRATFVVAWLVLYLGTVVTGSGPHAGDARAPRTGLDPSAMSQLHADLVFLLVGLTAGTSLALRAVHAAERAQLAVRWLLGLELVQGVVGFTQYFTGLPVPLVAVHLLGAGMVSAAATWVLLEVGGRRPQRI